MLLDRNVIQVELFSLVQLKTRDESNIFGFDGVWFERYHFCRV
jgi:hypothetical protein